MLHLLFEFISLIHHCGGILNRFSLVFSFISLTVVSISCYTVLLRRDCSISIRLRSDIFLFQPFWCRSSGLLATLVLYNGPIFRLTLAFSLTFGFRILWLTEKCLVYLFQGARVLWLQNMLLCTANMLSSVFTKHGAVSCTLLQSFNILHACRFWGEALVFLFVSFLKKIYLFIVDRHQQLLL